MFGPCYFHQVTGYWCPGCGGTRAVKALLSGDVIGSILYHPFPVFLIVFFLLLAGKVLRCRRHGTELPLTPFIVKGTYIGIGLTLISCTVKNLMIWQGITPGL